MVHETTNGQRQEAAGQSIDYNNGLGGSSVRFIDAIIEFMNRLRSSDTGYSCYNSLCFDNVATIM